MANTSAAKKAIRVSSRRNSINIKNKVEFRTARKAVYDAIEEKDAKKAQKLLPDAYKKIDFAAKKGAIKRKTADRYKSRLALAVASLK